MSSLNSFVDSINKEDYVKYLLITSVVVYFFAKFTDVNISILVGLIMGIVISVFLVEQKNNDTTTFNKDMEFKLKSLYNDDKIPKYFSEDSNMIELFSIISDYKEYNYSVYEKLLDRTDQFLQLKSDIDAGTSLIDYDFETAHDIYRNCMNYMRSFKLSLPMEFYNNHELAEKRYQVLMKRNMDEMLEKVKERPYNVFKKSTYYYDTTRPSDSYNEDDATSFGIY